jgi:hypothetical protein
MPSDTHGVLEMPAARVVCSIIESSKAPEPYTQLLQLPFKSSVCFETLTHYSNFKVSNNDCKAVSLKLFCQVKEN